MMMTPISWTINGFIDVSTADDDEDSDTQMILIPF